MPAAPCPNIHPSSPRMEPASCIRAHLGTVHVCSRRGGIARNHSRSGQASANRLAGMRAGRQGGGGSSTEKKKCGKGGRQWKVV